jgi:hypothetical protein
MVKFLEAHRDAIHGVLKRLHMRGLIKKVSRTRQWRVTCDGWRIMGTALAFYKEHYPQVLEKKAS